MLGDRLLHIVRPGDAAALDSVLFVPLAFGTAAAVGKTAATILTLAALRPSTLLRRVVWA